MTNYDLQWKIKQGYESFQKWATRTNWIILCDVRQCYNIHRWTLMAFSECVVLHADVLDAFDNTIWNQTTKNSFSKFD